MTLKKIYRILLTAACILLAAMLALAAVAVYRDGMAHRATDAMADIYSPAIVADKLAPTAPLFFAIIVLLAVAPALGVKGETAVRPVRAQMPPRAENAKRRSVIRAAVVVAAVALILLGSLNGSARDVFVKAVTICSECIGLG